MEHLLKQKAPFLPFCGDYSKLLDIVQQKRISTAKRRVKCVDYGPIKNLQNT